MTMGIVMGLLLVLALSAWNCFGDGRRCGRLLCVPIPCCYRDRVLHEGLWWESLPC
jgi:hypothetical protein